MNSTKNKLIMKKLLFIALLIGAISYAFVNPSISEKEISTNVSPKQINFKSITFAKALDEAKSTGKIIFIDAYTDWCGPCKVMSKNVFTNPDVAKVFNDKFINLKIEMEKNSDGPEIARLYKVSAYPTLIFVDGSGRAVKKAIGYKSAEELIAIANGL
jgi:thiol:disulfide interchange protein